MNRDRYVKHFQQYIKRKGNKQGSNSNREGYFDFCNFIGHNDV